MYLPNKLFRYSLRMSERNLKSEMKVDKLKLFYRQQSLIHFTFNCASNKK